MHHFGFSWLQQLSEVEKTIMWSSIKYCDNTVTQFRSKWNSWSVVEHHLHCIPFHFLSCLVLFCCTVLHCLFSFLNFSPLTTCTSAIKLNLNWIGGLGGIGIGYYVFKFNVSQRTFPAHDWSPECVWRVDDVTDDVDGVAWSHDDVDCRLWLVEMLRVWHDRRQTMSVRGQHVSRHVILHQDILSTTVDWYQSLSLHYCSVLCRADCYSLVDLYATLVYISTDSSVCLCLHVLVVEVDKVDVGLLYVDDWTQRTLCLLRRWADQWDPCIAGSLMN